MLKKISLNKKGDIPITILVLGVIAIIGLTLLSFYFFGGRGKNSFVVIDVIESLDSKAEKYFFYKNIGLSENEIQNILNYSVESNGLKFFEFRGKIYLGEKEFYAKYSFLE